MNKAAIRKHFIEVRKNIPRAEAIAKSATIAQRVQDLVSWHNVQRVHIYRAHRPLNEVETSWFEAYFATVWPKIEVTVGKVDKSANIPTEEYDLILVPLVTFDARRNRVGYGGGWYDTFLSFQPTAVTIGLGFDSQECTSPLPSERHDIRLDYIVTETRVIR